MTGLTVVAPLHLIACAILFGGFCFAALTLPDTAANAPALEARRRRLRAAGAWTALITAIVWFGLEAAAMSGRPLGAALDPPTLKAVLFQTHFGRVWIARLGWAALLCGLAGMHRFGARPAGIVTGALLSGGLLGSLASTGHADAVTFARTTQVAIYAVHLLAAGAWIGALPALALLLGQAARHPATWHAPAVRATERFSGLGLVCVIALFITGMVNAAKWVGSFGAFADTAYGQVLLGKLALFSIMLGFAAYNWLWLTPRLAPDQSGPAARLARNAWIEFGLGAIVLALAATLGATAPPVR